jgi:regulator of protease activity HflC (stomatin/prohibitin superfamily)
VQQGFVGLVERYGSYYKAVDSGLVNVNPVSETLRKIDIKVQIDPIYNMTIMTKDNVNIAIDCVVYWHIVDVYRATYGVKDVRQALIERTQTTMRAILGGRVLQDCIENREMIAHSIEEIIAGPASSWGVKVETILIKDIQFSTELQHSLSSAATQKRIGEAKVIAAQAEVDSAKLMREAANILNTPAAMQIRYLETMQQMSKQSGTKVIFMPMAETHKGDGDGEFGSKQGLTITDAYVREQMS